MVKLNINGQLNPISLATSQNRPASGSGGFMDPQKIVTSFAIKEGMKVADFGSGSGYFTILIAKLVGSSGLVTAVDVMETALDTVRAKARAENLENIDTVRSNLEIIGASGLKDESQDMVLLANILFQSNKKEEIVSESRRVLKDSGRLIVIDWKKGVDGFGPPDELRTDPAVMRQIVASAGFEPAGDVDAGLLHCGLAFVKKRA